MQRPTSGWVAASQGAGGGAPAPRPAPPLQVHHLFVLVGGTAEATAGTAQVLRFVAQCKHWFHRLGIEVKAQKVEAAHLRNPALADKFRQKGIVSFPALKTPNHLYLGVQAIVGVYARVIQQFKEASGRGAAPAGHGAAGPRRPASRAPGGYAGAPGDLSGGPELGLDPRRRHEQAALQSRGEAPRDPSLVADRDFYREYFSKELSLGAAEAGEEEIPVGDSSAAMMDSMRKMAERRAQIDERRRQKDDIFIEDRPPGAPTMSGVSEDEVVQHLLDEVNAPVTAKQLAVSAAKDGGEGARDNELAAMFWENQTSSM